MAKNYRKAHRKTRTNRKANRKTRKANRSRRNMRGGFQAEAAAMVNKSPFVTNMVRY